MVNDLIAGVAAGFRSSRRGLSIADLVDTLQSLSVEEAADALTQMPDARAVAVLDSPELRSAADILAHLTPRAPPPCFRRWPRTAPPTC